MHYPVYDEKGLIIKDQSKWKITKEVNAKELWDLIIKKAYDTGEYGVFFYDNINKDNNTYYMETIVNFNPCFTGDMKLLTSSGYKTFESLKDKEVDIINYQGNVSKGKVWSNGIKDIIEINLSNGEIIKCTPDHKFMNNQGEEVLAKECFPS